MNYQEEKEQYIDLFNKSDESQEILFRHILLVSASILGIVISLHSNNSQFLCIRWVFALSVLLLGLGTLLCGIVVYSHSKTHFQHLKDYYDELEDAMKSMRAMNDVTTQKSKLLLLSEKVSLILLVFGVLTLILYSVLSALFS